MTTFLLIRHALFDSVGEVLVGRTPGIHLNARGRAQAGTLAQRLAKLPVVAIYSSPLERALETAELLANRCHQSVEIVPEFIELDFGQWTGRTMAELQDMAQWQAFNAFRSGTRIPGGELMSEVQARALAALERLSQRHPEGMAAVVTHGDVLRAVLAYFLGMPIDLFFRLQIDPASVSVVHLGRGGPLVSRINSHLDWLEMT